MCADARARENVSVGGRDSRSLGASPTGAPGRHSRFPRRGAAGEEGEGRARVESGGAGGGGRDGGGGGGKGAQTPRPTRVGSGE